MTFASGSLRKEDVYECSTCISAQRGGQSAFLRAHRDLVCCSSPVEATACGGTAPAGPAAYVSDSGAGLSVSAGDGRSTPTELCRPCCLWRSPHDRPGWALPFVWLFNLVGITDLLFAGYEAWVTGLPFFHLGVAWLLLTVYVPLLLVSHVIVFWFLLRAAPSVRAERGSATF